MSIAESISPHLPYLRRFARALTGSQELGDASVLAVLEALIQNPGQFAHHADPRVSLYACFLKSWNAGGDCMDLDSEPKSIADERIEDMTPRPRQAFLLTSVEGFSPQETAEIMGCSRSEVAELVHQAGEEIAEQVATDVLIIEDEPLIAMDFEQLVEDLGHHVQGIARTHKEAVANVRLHRPGLILADIQLADGSSGLDAINEILMTVQVPVIFVTAFPERLLTGERPEPAFLITKPFQTTHLRAIISQALFFDTKAAARAPC